MNQLVWKPETHTNCSSLFVCSTTKTFLLPASFAVVLTGKSKVRAYHPKPGNLGYSTHPFSQFSYWLFLHTCCDRGSTTASLMHAPYIPDIWLETCGSYCLYEIGFLVVAGCLHEHGWIPMKAELVEGVVVLCGRWTVSAEAGVT